MESGKMTAPLTAAEALEYQTRLWRLLAWQTERYTMGESTSVRKETAQALLASVRLSLELHFREQGLPPRALLEEDPTELLRAAEGTVRRQVGRTRLLYQRACRCALREESRSLDETLQSIGDFFRVYDPRFFAAEVPCDIDYQLCRPAEEKLGGVLYVRAYLEQLAAEDAFLRRFDPAAVRRVLMSVCPAGHRELLVNLYEPVAAAALGLTLTEGDISSLGQTASGWEQLTELLGPPGRDRRRHLLEQAGKCLAGRLELGPEAAAYLTEFSRSLLPRAEAVLASGSGWQGIFPILE